MVGFINDIVIFCLVPHLCLTSGILTTKPPRDSQPRASLQSPPNSYPATATSKFPKLLRHAAFTTQTLQNGLKDAGDSGGHVERESQAGYSYLKPASIEFKLPLRDQKIKSFSNQRSLQEIQATRVAASTRTPETSRASAPRPRAEVEYHPHVPRRSSYQVVEEHDEYLTNDSDHAGLPYRGKAQTTYPHRDSQDITTAIKALDHFLSGVLNGDSYNSELHPPPNPVLALVLSRYGRYVPGARNPRVYAHMAVNNIHNNKPFGSYKVEREEEPTYGVR